MSEIKRQPASKIADNFFQVCLSGTKNFNAIADSVFWMDFSERQDLFNHLFFRIRDFFSQSDSNFHYRTFDPLDLLFGIKYVDEDMALAGGSGERLYFSAGVGVQTGYSNLFESIDRMSLKPGHRVIDLGSGYGRLGYLLGYLFSDVTFTGYEFVLDRVQDGNANLTHLGLSSRIQFLQQDLSSDQFRLPWANVYYMYDPFTPATYEKVLAQLVENSRLGAFKIITKGAATEAVETAAKNFAGVLRREKFDNGNLCLFDLE